MDKNLFNDLVSSIKEAGAIKREDIQASQITKLELPDIRTSSNTHSNFRHISKPNLKLYMFPSIT